MKMDGNYVHVSTYYRILPFFEIQPGLEGDFGGYPDNDEDQEAAAEAEYEEGNSPV